MLINSFKINKILLNRVFIIFFSSILFACLFPAVLLAAELNLEQAMKIGLKNNIDLKNYQNEVVKLKHDLALIRAQQGWQIDFTAEYDNVIEQPESDNSDSWERDGYAQDGRTTLGISREYSSGFSLNPEISYDGSGKKNYHLELELPIFPYSPAELEKDYYIKKTDYLTAQNDYILEKKAKILEWLEDYLEILRLTANINNLKLNLKQAAKNLKFEQEKNKLDQAGETEILTAEIAYLDAKNNYQNSTYQLENNLAELKIKLGLNSKTTLMLEDHKLLAVDLNNMIVKYEKKSHLKLYPQLIKADLEINSLQLQKKLLEEQLIWLQYDNKTSFILTGSYDQENDESILGLIMNYDLYDGGKNDLEQSKLKAEIELQQKKIADLKLQKSVQLKTKLNKIKTAHLTLNSKQLALKKAKLELNNALQKKEQGLISQSEFLSYEIDYYNALDSHQKAADQLLIARLDLNKLLVNDFLYLNKKNNSNQAKKEIK